MDDRLRLQVANAIYRNLVVEHPAKKS